MNDMTWCIYFDGRIGAGRILMLISIDIDIDIGAGAGRIERLQPFQQRRCVPEPSGHARKERGEGDVPADRYGGGWVGR